MKRTLPILLLLAIVIAVVLVLRTPSSPDPARATGAGEPHEPTPSSLTAGAPPPTLEDAARRHDTSTGGKRQEVADTRPTLTIRGRIEADPRLPLTKAVMRVVERKLRGSRSTPSGPFGNSFGGIVPIDPAAPEHARADVHTDGTFELTVRGVASSGELALLLEHDHYLLPTPTPVPLPDQSGEVDVGTLRPLLGALVVGRVFGFNTPGKVEIKLVAEPDMMAPARDPFLFAAQIAGSMRAAVQTDQGGHFALRGVAPCPSAHARGEELGPTDATSAAGGDLFGTSSTFALAPGETREVTIHARPSAKVEVLVRDDHGQPVAGANVRVSTTAGALTGRAAASRSQGTDALGVAIVRGAMPGENRIAIEAYGFKSLRETRSLQAGAQRFELALVPSQKIAGRVADEQGQPIEGARIGVVPAIEIPVFGDVSSMTGPEAFAQAAEQSPCRSDADGKFVLLCPLDDDTLTVIAVHEDFAPKTETSVEPGASDVELVLAKLARVEGRVVDAATSTALPAFDVEIVASMMMGMEQVMRTERVRAAEDGRFSLALSPVGATLRITAAGYGRATRKLQPEPGATTEVGDIAMEASAHIAGKVIDDLGAPVQGARVQVVRGGIMDHPMFAAMSGATDASATTDQQGHFRLDDITPGRVRLRATHAAFASGDSPRVEIATGQARDDVVITLDHGGSIDGRLLLAPGTRVADWDVYAGEARGGSMPATAALAGDGTFRIENLAPGTYNVQAMNTRAFTSVLATSMSDGDRPNISGLLKNIMNKMVQTHCQVRRGETATVDLDASELETGGSTLRIEVMVGDERFDEGFVEVRSEGMGGRVAPIEKGTAEVAGLRPGTVTLQVRAGIAFAAVGEPQSTTIERAGEEKRFTLRLPGGILAGRVVDADRGEPIRGASVRARRTDAVASSAGEIGFALTDASGHFRFRGLAPGAYNVVADEVLGGNRERTSGRIDGLQLSAGQTRDDLVLYARAGAQVSVTVRNAAAVPIAHAMVLIVDADGQPAASLPVAFTDADGRADLAGLPDGPVRAVARVPTLSPGVSDLVHATGGRELKLDVTLHEGTDVHLHIEDAQGQPLPGARVAVRLGEGPWLPTQLLGVAAGSADLELGALPPGAVTLRIVHPRAGTFEVGRTIPTSRRTTLTVTAPER